MRPAAQARDDFRRRVSPGTAWLGLAFAVEAAVLVGWVTDQRWLCSFGVRDYPHWPLTALGELAIAVGQSLLFVHRPRLGIAVLLLPLAIAAAAVVEYSAPGLLHIDEWMFPQGVRQWQMPLPGRPGLLAASSMIGLAVISLMAVYAEERQNIVILTIGSILVGFGWMSLGLLLFGFAPELASHRLGLARSLPGAIAMICLTCSVFAYRAASEQAGLFAPGTAGARAIRLALPVLLILPMLLLPLERIAVAHGVTSNLSASIVTVAAIMAAAVVLVAKGIERIGRDHAALVESEARLQHALEAHRIGLFDWHIATDTLRWSPGAETRLGLETGSMNDFGSWSARVPDEDSAQVMAAVAETRARKGDRYSFRYRIRRADGDERVVEGSARCFYDRNGELERVAGVNIDVTERVRHEAEIARREAQWLSILATAPDAMIVIDRTGIVQSFGAAAERMFGYPAEMVVGRSMMMLLPEADTAAVTSLLARGAMAGLQRRATQERTFVARRQDGSHFPVEYSVGETIVGDAPIFTAFVRDISDRQAAERRFAALQLEYAHSARVNAVGELASGLAHELNQPLAAGANYLGTAELLLADIEGAELAGEMVGEAAAQLLRAGEIIRRLRDFIAKTDIDMRAEPLEETLREAVALGLVGARRQQIAIDYRLDPAADAIFADRIQVQQVVVNLVRNAAEAMRLLPADRRRITIAARPIDADLLEVSIADQGPGLPPEVLEELFAPFRSTKAGAGLGIGLSICRRIIEAHGGAFSAENIPDQGGAKFSFTLARVQNEQQEGGSVCVTSMS